MIMVMMKTSNVTGKKKRGGQSQYDMVAQVENVVGFSDSDRIRHAKK